jgi:myosin protein heavy chain
LCPVATSLHSMANERQHADYQRYLKFKKDDLFQVPSDKKFAWFNPDPKDRDTFASAEVLKEGKDEWVLRTEEGQTVTVKTDFISPRNPAKFDGVEDMSELGYLNEAGVLHNLRLRYNKDVIYTYSGLFLVAINPYKRFPIYSDSIIDIYKGRRRNEVAPHIFAIADGAYRSMLGDKVNQSILITGESGAGKTENTKKVIQYLTSVAGRAAGSDNSVSLESQILQANPILESFGNAKTTRNNNSSRFGKFIEVQFNSAGYISGAKIQSYLLEKSRVVFQAERERTFHIFYQLLAGASPEERKSMFLGPPDSYFYLNQSGCYDVQGINDANDFKDTKSACAIMNITDEEQQAIFRVISGILHLGNINFTQSYGDASVIQEKTALNYAASMLNVTPSVLEKGLIEPRIQTGKELVSTHLTPAKAKSGRDALAKAIYHRLFLWIVKKINMVLCQEKRVSFIGVLDIAGFEIFKNNSFEQLCINFTNEKLQQFFNHHMFTLEQEEYKKERIDWTFIDFGMDSQATIELIESKTPPGIFALLDEQSVFPNATDQTLITKLHTHFGGGQAGQAGKKKHPKYEEPRFADKLPNFGVYHYAGTVSYDVTNWLEKNKDPLQPDLEACLRDSKDTFVRRLFTEHFEDLPTSLAEYQRKGTKGAAFVTVAAQYKSQLSNLMSTLQATHPHFVRCILPNHQQKPGFLEDACVLDQLRCNGVLEGIRITRLGFPNRTIYSEFVKRYYLLVPDVPRNPQDPKPATASILKGLKIPESEYRFGLTKVFFRAGQLAYIEEIRERRIGEIVKVVQAAARGWVERKHFRQAREKSISARIIQDNIRAYLEFKNWAWWKLFAKARPLLVGRNMDKELKDRDSKIKELNSQLTAEKAARAELERQLKEAENKIAQLQEALKAEKQNVANLQDTNADLKQEVINHERKVAALEGDLAEQTKLLDSVSAARKEAEIKVKELTAALADEKEARLNLEKAKRKVEDELDEAKKQHDFDVERIANLEKLKNELQAEVEELSDQFADETKARASMEKQKRKLDSDFEDLEQKYQDEVTQRSELNKLKNQLDSELKSTTAQLESEVERRGILEGLQKKLEAALAAETAKFEEEQKNRAALDKAKKALEQQHRDLTQELQDEKKNKEALEKARKKLEQDLNELRDQLEHEGGNVKALADLKQKVEQELEDLRKQVEELKATVSKLEKIKRTLEAQLAEANTAQAAAEAENANLLRTKKKLEEDIEALNKKLADEQRDKAALDKAKKKAEQDLKDLKANFENVSTARGTLDQNLKAVEEKLENSKVEYEQEVKTRQQLEKSKKLLETELHAAQQQLDDEKKGRELVDRKRSDLEAEIAELREDFEEALSARKVVTDAKSKLQSDYEELKKQAEADAAARQKYQDQVKNLELQIQDLQSATQDAEAAAEKIERQRRALEADLQDVQEKLDEEQKARVRFQKQWAKTDEELRMAKLKIDDLTTQTSDQYVALKRLQEENANQHRELEASDEKAVTWTRLKKQNEVQIADLKAQLDEAIAAKLKVEKQKRDLEGKIEELEIAADAAIGKVDAEVLRQKQTEIEELKKHLAVEHDRKTKDEETKKQLRKDLTAQEEAAEEYERQKLNAERIRKKLEGELEDLKASLESEQILRKKAELLAKPRAGQKEGATEIKPTVSSKSDEEVKKIQDELAMVKQELDGEKAWRSNAEKRERALRAENDELRGQLEDEVSAKDKINKAKRALEVDVEELKDQIDEIEEQLQEAEEFKRRKDMELEEVKRKIEGEAELTLKFEEAKKQFEKDIENLKIELEEERRSRGEAERIRKRLEAENDDLNIKLDNEIKSRQKTEKAKKKIEGEFKATRTRLDEESATKTQQENFSAKLEEEIAKLKEDLDAEVKNKALIERTRKSLELQLEDTRTQMEVEARQRANADKLRRQAENELEDLREQVDAFEETTQDLESAKTRLEVELEEARKSNQRENEAREAAETARARIARELSELREKYDEEVIIRTNLERMRKKAEADYEDAKEQLEVESKLRAKLERDIKAQVKGGKDLQTAKAEADKLRARVSALEKMEADYKKLQARLTEEEDARRAAENEKKKAIADLNEARSDVSFYQAQADKIRNDWEKEKKSTEELQANLASLLGLTGGASARAKVSAQRKGGDSGDK